MPSNEYMRKYLLDRYYNRREESFRILGGSCSNCGSTDNLEIDHINPKDKRIQLGKMWSVSRERYLEELKKCQLLCSGCHLDKTSIEKSVEHGGGKSGKRNCPCSLCKSRKSEYMRNYDRKKR